MMVAAFAGRRGAALTAGSRSRCCSARRVALIGAPSHAGPLFGGLIVADLFGAFGKAIIFPAPRSRSSPRTAGSSAISSMRRISGADPVQRGRHGGDGLGDQPDLALRRARAAEPRGLRPRLLPPHRRALGRGGPQIFRARRARQRHPALRHFAALRLHRHDEFDRHRRRLRARGAPSLGLLFGLVFLLAGLAFKISAVPFHMWTPDVYEGAPTPVTAFFASAPKVAAVLLATRVCLDALGPATDAWRQIVIFAALASIFLGAVAAYGQTNIKRLLAYSSINNVGFALIGLAAGGPRARRRCCSTWRSMSS
jgi:NADH-quinone oxidoreductase subunit N